MRPLVPIVRRHIVLICILVILSSQSFAQSITTGNGKIEIGLGFGPLFFVGDLGGNPGPGKTFIKDVNLPLTKLQKGIYINLYPSEWLGVRVALNQGVIEAYDSIVKDKGGQEGDRLQRNLSFKSNLLEAYLAIEIYPTVFFEQYDGLAGKLRPYGLIGIGGFKFNPMAEYIEPNKNRRWVELRPLRLEGQGMAEYPDRKQYSLMQIEVPMGVGFKYYIKENMYVGFEILHRMCFSDYLDNVSTKYIDPNLFSVYLSPADVPVARQLMYRERFYDPTITRPYINYQRGDPKDNDAFFSNVLRFGWRLGGSNDPNSRALRQLRCPSFY